jgi:hypothetical protein
MKRTGSGRLGRWADSRGSLRRDAFPAGLTARMQAT